MESTVIFFLAVNGLVNTVTYRKKEDAEKARQEAERIWGRAEIVQGFLME